MAAKTLKQLKENQSKAQAVARLRLAKHDELVKVAQSKEKIDSINTQLRQHRR